MMDGEGERKAIVAWLRKGARQAAENKTWNPVNKIVDSTLKQAFHGLADAIERGAHLTGSRP